MRLEMPRPYCLGKKGIGVLKRLVSCRNHLFEDSFHFSLHLPFHELCCNCWFSVSRYSKQIKIKIKSVQQMKSGIWEMKGGKYTKFLAKIQVRRIFRIRDIRRNVLPKFIEICMETLCWCPPGWAPNLADGNQQKHLLPSLGTKA